MKFFIKDGICYVDVLHGDKIPTDAEEITQEQYQQLLADRDAPKPLLLEGNDLILSQIAELESTATPRRLREAAIGADGGWLKNLDDKITTLRKKLK